MTGLGSILTFLLSHLELVFVALFLIGSFLNLINRAGKTLSDQQRRVMTETELQRRRLLEEQSRLEANPNTQSYSGYLQRTRPEKLEDHDGDGMDDNPDGLFKDDPIPRTSSNTQPTDQSMKDFQADILAALGMKPEASQPKSVQDVLRGQLAQKMGRASTSSAQSQSGQTVRSRAKSISAAQSAATGITSSLNPEITAQRVTFMTDSNAGVANSSLQVKQVRENSTTTSNSTRFGTTNDVVRGIIWSEILKKPKASRR